MRSELIQLREKMQESGIDLYLIPTTDDHGSEYVNDHFKCREYVSGFTGSAGTLIVGHDFAGLWTDGRYFLQAAQQLKNSGITLMKMGEPDVPDPMTWLKQQLPDGNDADQSDNALREFPVIGFDGRIVSCQMGSELEQIFPVRYDLDLVDEIWAGRPQIQPSKIYELPQNVTGQSKAEKLERIRNEMGNADYLLVTRLEDLAWIYNLRGRDIENTPVFYGYALISQTSDMLYVMDEDWCSCQDHVKSYDELQADLQQLRNCSIMLDEDSVSYAVGKAFHPSVQCILCKSPAERLKAVKNKAEIESTKNAHVRDGAAMAEFLYWLKSSIGEQDITEISAADQLEKYRRARGAYDLSFTTIAGYEEHGAIIHYAATEDSDVTLKPQGFLLVDSGGQYEDGTTDITRTIALGTVEEQRKIHYTAVLKGHIALASAIFDKETTGAQLDATAREPIQKLGLDYKHGTGHGVGHMLSVHEGPNTISPRGKCCSLLPGMITSDEPGVYLEGRYGIRIENELLCIETGSEENPYGFEPLTYCPYEREAIDVTMLTEQELEYIDRYHAAVQEHLEALLKEPVKSWLVQQCRPLQR